MNPAQIGPIIRPRLIKELLNPIAAPCPAVVCLEINAKAAGRSRVFERIKKAVASRIVK